MSNVGRYSNDHERVAKLDYVLRNGVRGLLDYWITGLLDYWINWEPHALCLRR